MSENKELVAVTPQKHDPAWKHCQMFKSGDKVELECRYCDKNFKGGGIHRIKEHLAGQKGNAATCLQVPQHVKIQMLESLNGVAAKKRKKQKLVEEISGCENQGGNVDNNNTNSNNCGLNTEFDLIPVPEMVEHDANVYADREEDTSKRGGRKKRGRVRKALGSNNPCTVVSSLKKGNQIVDKAIGRFLIDVGLPLDAVNSSYFQPMIEAISSLREGTPGPSYHDLRSWILKDLVHEVRSNVDECSVAWGRTGCSILVNEWNSAKGKTYVNFSVYCSEGTVFLRSADISDAVDSADAIYDCLRETVEEVGVENVVQVITSTEDRYAVAGNRLTETYSTVCWTPCAAHCIDLMLNDIGKLPKVKMILDQAKTISRYIYMNNVVLKMMRKYTYGIDLVDLGYTCSCTDFMTLKRMVSIKHNLQSMFTSEEWMDSPYSKSPEGFAVLDCISNQSFWTECASITSLVDPLLRLFRIVGSEKRPAMGYVFAGLYRAKETIKKELVNKEDYVVYWNIINHRWEQLHRNPLHAAGFYFNPKFFYSLEGDAHLRIRSLVYDCIEKLVADPDIQDKIMKETASYHGSVGDLGRKMAVRARDTLLHSKSPFYCVIFCI